MMKQFLFIMCFISHAAFSQHNFLGKSLSFISEYYEQKTEYNFKLDTISENSIMITCKSNRQYPFYTYEIDQTKDRCISYGFVSKNREILDTYIDILDYLGVLLNIPDGVLNPRHPQGMARNSSNVDAASVGLFIFSFSRVSNSLFP